VTRFRWLTLLVLAVVIAVVVPRVAVERTAAQDTYQAGLGVTLRAARYVTWPGVELPLQLTLANVGTRAVNVPMGCDAGIDIRVYGPDGGLVWRLHPTCVEQRWTITLAAGHEQSWRAVWTGVKSDGTSVAPGVYSIYGVVQTFPQPAVAGPVIVEVGAAGDVTRTPEHREPTHEATRTPEHREPTREASRTPEHREPTREATRTPTVPAESGTPFPIADGEGREVRPDVAGHPELGDCQNLVVWWNETAGKIYGRFVEREWRGNVINVSGDFGAVGPPKVAYNIGRKVWLVVWADVTDGGARIIRARYLRCGSDEGGVFHIGGDGAADDQPVVASHGEYFAVAWRRAAEGGGHRILGAYVVGMETRLLTSLSGDPSVVSEPAIACEVRGDCLVAWTRGEAAQRDVVGRYWFPRENYVGTRLLEIAVTGHAERYPSIAWNGWYDRGAYAVTWTEEGEAYTAVRARTVYPGEGDRLDGYVLGTPVILVSAEDSESDHADVAQLGPGFVVVWSAGATVPGDIVTRRLAYDPLARTLTPGPIGIVGEHDARETYPAVPSSLDPLTLVVWQIEREGGMSDILGRHFLVPPATGRVILLGVVAGDRPTGGAGSDLDAAPGAGARWNITVLAVIEGTFECTAAVVLADDPALVDDRVARGDLVTVRGDLAPAQGACVLTVGATGTSITRATVGQTHLPFAWH
jgi:hypothetical protein